MSPDRTFYHTLKRVTLAAQEETNAILRALPAEIRERLGNASVRFEPRPDEAMLKRGVSPEAVSVSSREAGEIVFFLMNLFERHYRHPGDFREAYRRELLRELGDWAGVDLSPE